MTSKKSSQLILIALLLGGGILRFYKLNWGHDLFFHPDEYHIIGAVERIQFPNQLNPHFFSYGSFTIYTLYFIKTVWSNIFDTSPNLFLLGRGLSAFYATATILISYLISKHLFSEKKYYPLSTLLVAITPGLIQQAHFATPESSLTFWLLTTLLLLLKSLGSTKRIFYSALTFGVALGTKIVAFTYSPLFLLTNLFAIKKFSVKNIVKIIFLSTFLLLLSFSIAFLVFPYSILDWDNFLHSMRYETGVGRGDPLVFYTRQFIDTKPFVFQLEKILPYTLGPSLLMIGSIGFFLILKDCVKKANHKTIRYKKWLLVLTAFTLFFVSNAILFTKWTRFVAPVFAFWSFFAVYFLKVISNKIVRKSIAGVLLTTTALWLFMFFSIYTKDDVRIQANKWIEKNIPSNSIILTESGNMLEVPFSGFKRTSFDFYSLDGNLQKQNNFIDLLGNSDYFIVQSRRVYANNMRFPTQYPFTTNFYEALFDSSLGFTIIAEFSSYPQMSLWEKTITVPDEKAEETWSVFDHPVVRIYRKEKFLTKKEYNELLY